VYLVAHSHALTGDFYYLYLFGGMLNTLLFFLILMLPRNQNTLVSP